MQQIFPFLSRWIMVSVRTDNGDMRLLFLFFLFYSLPLDEKAKM